MIAQGFKPVGWVAAVAGAALGCYMLSLNVAAERAELAKVERQIVAAKQEIRTLQTELGTRGRMQQLEHWNAEVLALSAPTASQFLDNPVTLARFETKEPTLDDKARVTIASADVNAPARAPEIAAGRKLSPADYAKVAARAAANPSQQVRLASAAADDKPPVIKASVVRMSATPSSEAVAPKPVAPKPVATKPATPETPRIAKPKLETPKLAVKTETRKPAAKPEPNVAGLKAVIDKADDKPAKPAARTADAKPAKAAPAKKVPTPKSGDGA